MTLKINTNEFSNNSSESIKIEESGSYTYVGYAVLSAEETDPVWRIKRLYESGSFTYITYANGNDLYNNQWANRYTITYL